MALKQIKVKIGDRWYTVDIEEPIGSVAKVTVEGEIFEVEVAQLESAPQRVSGDMPMISSQPRLKESQTIAKNDSVLITSPMSGKILSISVKPGDSVNAGDEICVIEAMKMEQTIKSHRDGVIKEVLVKPLDQVVISTTLVQLE